MGVVLQEIQGKGKRNLEKICIVRNPNYIASIDQENRKMRTILLGILPYDALNMFHQKNKKMKKIFLALSLTLFAYTQSVGCDKCKAFAESPDFKIKSSKVVYNKKLGTLEFEMIVEGKAGNTRPDSIGKLDMAQVLAYVFPTDLKAEDVGFNPTEGIVALALTSHPDFDDSPMWDENMDGNFGNDGLVWHPHWVVLVRDERVKGGLAVKEYKKADEVKKPKTAPDMPMYMDSPGFPVVTEGNTISVSVPAYRINNKVRFKYDAVTCYLEVSAPASGMAMDKPMLGVYKVFSVLSKDLSLPFSVK